MSKKQILENIEDGLLNYYLDKDYSIDKRIESESEELYEGQLKKYQNFAKQILFKAKISSKEDRVAKIISIAEATGKLKSLEIRDQENVFSIFKKHVEQKGLAANYRNFENMTKEEMANILQQLDITALFDEISATLEDE